MMQTQLSDEQLLERLVAFSIVHPQSSEPIAAFIQQYAHAHGVWQLRQVYNEDAAAQVNLLLARGPLEAAGGLVLSGHMDVVPAVEPDWASDPFELSARDGRLYGRGTSDMKGFVALALNALAELDESELRAPLMLLITSEEEIGTVGAAHFAASYPTMHDVPRLPPRCLIGEPTLFSAVRQGKGHLKLRVSAKGKPAHSGLPHLGDSAIAHAVAAFAALRGVEAEWKQKPPPSAALFPECPHATLNVGTIHGGAAVNIVPAACEMNVGIRLLPGQKSPDAISDVQRALDGLPEPTRRALSLSVIGDTPPLGCGAADALYRVLCEQSGQKSEAGVAYATDAGPLQSLFEESVIWGPGDITRAHKANEFIEREEMRIGAERLRQIIQRFCIDGADA